MHELHESALDCMPKIASVAATFFHKALAISVEKGLLIAQINKEVDE